MRYFYQLLSVVFFFFNSVSAQEINGEILDSKTGEVLESATITLIRNEYTVFTDSQGVFRLNSVEKKDSIRISHIGYQTKTVELDAITENTNFNASFYLEPKAENLGELVIPRKVQYKSGERIKPVKVNSHSLGFQFGTENCTLIPNPKKKKGKVKAIVLDLIKMPEYNKDIPKWKLDYLATLSIKFYNFNAKENKPAEEVYGKKIIVEPDNKTYKLEVNVDSLDIPFPEDGICIGVEMINTRYNNPKKSFAVIAPAINFADSREFHPIAGWIRYRNEDWKFKTPLSQDEKGKKYNKMIVDAVVKFEE